MRLKINSVTIFLVLISFSFSQRKLDLSLYIEEVLKKFDEVDLSAEIAELDKKIKNNFYEGSVNYWGRLSTTNYNYVQNNSYFSNRTISGDNNLGYHGITKFGTRLDVVASFDRMNRVDRFLMDSSATNFSQDVYYNIHLEQSLVHGIVRYALIRQLAEAEYDINMLDLKSVKNTLIMQAIDHYTEYELTRRRMSLRKEQMHLLKNLIDEFDDAGTTAAKIKVLHLEKYLINLSTYHNNLEEYLLYYKTIMANATGCDLSKEDLILSEIKETDSHFELYKKALFDNIALKNKINEKDLEIMDINIRDKRMSLIPEFNVFSSFSRTQSRSWTNDDRGQYKPDRDNFYIGGRMVWKVNNREERLMKKRDQLILIEDKKRHAYNLISDQNRIMVIEKNLDIKQKNLADHRKIAETYDSSLDLCSKLLAQNLAKSTLNEDDMILLDQFFSDIRGFYNSRSDIAYEELKWLKNYYYTIYDNYNYLVERPVYSYNYYNSLIEMNSGNTHSDPYYGYPSYGYYYTRYYNDGGYYYSYNWDFPDNSFYDYYVRDSF